MTYERQVTSSPVRGQTSQLYLSGISSDETECVWRMSLHGAGVQRWLTEWDTFKPRSLSVTSTRVLVSCCHTNQLIQFDAVGEEVRRIQPPEYVDRHIYQAVESSTGTFIISHEKRVGNYVTEVITKGQVLHTFSGTRLVPLRLTDIALDSQRNVFVSDHNNHRILLLDAKLALRRVIIDEHQLNDKEPWRLCYNEQSGQLLVGFYDVGSDTTVAVFDVNRR